MKHIFIVLFVSATTCVNARIITVSNSPLNPGQQFTSVTLAMSIAVAGDTIYVHGSTINYGSIYVSRPGLVVIGTGHMPQKQFPVIALFTDITVDGDNCQLIGLVAENIIVRTVNFTMKRCKILGPAFGPGLDKQFSGFGTLLLEGNVFTGGDPNVNMTQQAGDNITIRNNILSGRLDAQEVVTPTSFLLLNNIFLKGPFAVTNINHATINNNIFYGSSPVYAAGATITANHNITFQCSNDLFPMGPDITLSNNLEGVDPQFVNYPGGNAVFSFLHDYHLAAGSPGLASGSDGTDRAFTVALELPLT